jgi:hypothetical protein
MMIQNVLRHHYEAYLIGMASQANARVTSDVLLPTSGSGFCRTDFHETFAHWQNYSVRREDSRLRKMVLTKKNGTSPEG